MSDEQEPWMDLNKWEQQCIDEVEKTPDLEIELQNAKDSSEQKLWLLFQNAATCITQLYKGKMHIYKIFKISSYLRQHSWEGVGRIVRTKSS